MTVYYSTNIKTNILGGNTNISLTQTSPVNDFLASTGTEKYIITSLNLWSDNIDQIRQPLTFITTDANGKQVSKTKVPQLDSYQKQIALNNYGFDNTEFDENSKFQYELLPGAKIRMTLNLDDKHKGILSNVEELIKSLGLDKESVVVKMVNGELPEFGETELKDVPASWFEEKEEKEIKEPETQAVKEPEKDKKTAQSIEEKKTKISNFDKRGLIILLISIAAIGLLMCKD